MANVGSATIDFGAGPGLNETSVVVTGQASIASGSYVEAFWMADDTSSSHTANDHKYAPLWIVLTCGVVVAGTGFTIFARALDKMTGTWTVRWTWA